MTYAEQPRPRVQHYEDLSVGLTFTSPGRTITEADVVAFAGLTGDYSEQHTSEEFASQTQFGRRIAHGLLGLSFAHGLMWARTGQLRECAIAFLGISDWRFTAPLFLGDTMFVRYTVANLRDSRSSPDKAIVTWDVEIVNQHDEVVQKGKKVLLVSKVPLTAAAAGPQGRRHPASGQTV